MEPLEKFFQFLDTLDKINLIGDLNSFPDEMDNFRSDLKKFGIGVYLWCEDKYPNISKNFISLKFIPEMFKLRNPEDIIGEYYHLVKITKRKYPNLVNQELKSTQKLFLAQSINPIEILLTKYDLIQRINDNLMKILPRFIDYIPKVTEVLKLYSNIIKKHTTAIKLKSKRKNPKFKKSITLSINQIKKEFYQRLPSSTKKLSEELSNDLEKISEDLDYLNKDIKKSIFRQLLLIKDLDSFNIDFIKFIGRLYYILENGNRNYINNIKIDYQFSKRKKLINFIKNRFYQNYPNLSHFLISYLKFFVNPRNLDAHNIPNIQKFSKNRNYVTIPIPKTNKCLKWKISIIKKATYTYIAIIEALRLYYN